MKKGYIYSVTITVVALVAYTIILFLFKQEKGITFWIAYMSALVAVLVAEGMSIRLATSERRVTFLQIPIYQYCSIYAIAQLMVGMILALFVSNVKAVVLIEVLLYAIFLILLFITMQGKELLENMENDMVDSTRFISGLRLEAESLYINAKGTVAEKKLQELSDAIRYSDPVSCVALQQIETELQNAFGILKEKCSENPETIISEADNVLRILAERNRKCKALK